MNNNDDDFEENVVAMSPEHRGDQKQYRQMEEIMKVEEEK